MFSIDFIEYNSVYQITLSRHNFAVKVTNRGNIGVFI